MKKLYYRGWYGTCYQAEDDEHYFYGSIQGIQDLITYQAPTEIELEYAFRTAIGDYLEDCKKLGKVPEMSKE